MQQQNPKTMKAIAIPLVCAAFMLANGCTQNKPRPETAENGGTASKTHLDSAKQAPAVPDTDTIAVKITSHSDNTMTIAVTQGGREIQGLEYKFQDDADMVNPGSRKPNCTLRDVTFDGNKDLLINFGSYGNQGVEYYNCFVWDAKAREFVYEKTFDEIENPTANTKYKCVFSQSRSSAAEYVYKKYVYRNGGFRLAAELHEYYSQPAEDGSAPPATYMEYAGGKPKSNHKVRESEISAFWKGILH